MAKHYKPLKKERVIRYSGQFVAQLIMIFISIYAAFLVDRQRGETRLKHKRDNYYLIILKKLEVQMELFEREIPVSERLLNNFEAKLHAGQKPRLLWQHYTNPNYDVNLFGNAMDVFNAQLLAPELYEKITTYHSSLLKLINIESSTTRFSLEHILPYLKQQGHFYIPGTTELKSEYRQYTYYQKLRIAELQFLWNKAKTIVEELRAILGLEERPPGLEGQ